MVAMRPPSVVPPRSAGLVAAALAALLLALTACAHESDTVASDDTGATTEPTDGQTDEQTGGQTGGPDDQADPTGGRTFSEPDYVYRLEVLCYCPQVGAVRVVVADGEVVRATTLGGGRGFTKGQPAPEFARLTINDVIDRADDPAADHVEVTWPEGQEWPSVVAIDHLAGAVDDEVTYTIKNVRVR